MRTGSRGVRAGTLACAAVAFATLLRTAGPAAAAPPKFTFVGRGWGHGVGMSQFGAKGLALRGTGARSILRHYYRGISISARSNESLRVLVATDQAAVTVTSDRPFTAWRGSRKIGATGSTYRALRALPIPGGYRLQKGKSNKGPWYNATTTGAMISFKPGKAALQLVTRGPTFRYYRGKLEARRLSDTKIAAVNNLPMEHYLRGVVPQQTYYKWPGEALKAQSIAARSFAFNAKAKARAAGRWYDLCGWTGCAKYGGLGVRKPGGKFRSTEQRTTSSAVAATRGLVMTHPDEKTAGRVIKAFFHSSSGGRTEHSTDVYNANDYIPYLRSVDDRYALSSAVENPNRWWSKAVTQSLAASKAGLDRVDAIRVVERNASGSVRTLAIDGLLDGSLTTLTFSGKWVRQAFGLRSAFVRRIE